MAKALLSDLFGSYLSEELNQIVGNAIVEKCTLNIENRYLEVQIESDHYINRQAQFDTEQTIKQALKLEEIEISFTFSSDALCAEACEELVNEIKIKNAALNGYFANAEYSFSDDTVKITLKYGGYKKICELPFERDFILLVKQRFGKEITLSFDGQLDDIEIELPPAEPVQRAEQKSSQQNSAPKEKAAAPKTEIKFEKRDDKPQNGLVYLDSPKLFYGRRIDTNTKPMINVTGDDTEICCWGEVFETEVRTINTKRGEMNIFTFSFSDHTNSLTATMFIDPKRMGEVAPVKTGEFILVNGSYEFDNYKKDFLVKPKAMALLQKYTETDDYDGEKRVELHCHTNMSAKDAVSSAGDIINQAFKWGHKAVAITDHGVVQAYPAAAEAVKKIRKGGGDFKVIYGVEGYFVDDVNNDISKLNAKQIGKMRHHQIILVKNLVGLKNLYKLVSEAHLHDYHGKPITLRSKLEQHREG